MTMRTKRLGTTALLAFLLGCSSSNEPATSGTGGAAVLGTGGTTSTGGSAASGTGGGTGGATGAGTGGTTTASSGGTTGAAGGSGFGQPACGNTAAGVAVKKGGTCAAGDPQMCFNTCGPEKSGVKSETCTNGVYAEGSCMFDPAKDFSCYKIPGSTPAACPTTAIQSGAACTVPDCTVCGGTTGYLDSSMTMKTGYCVCQAGSSNPTWSCASTTAWPCPSGSGC